MKYLIFILIGILLASTAQAIRFDWSMGQPTEALNNTAGTSTDAIWWVLGQPSVVASTTVQGEAPPPPLPSERNRIMIISENLQFVKNKNA